MIEHPIHTTLVGAVLWRRLDVTSLEHCRLLEMPDFRIIDGRVLTVLDGQPSEVHYSVLCERDWTTREAHVALVQGAETTQLHLRRDEAAQWLRNEERVPDLEGLHDVDISITPSTNTLPIRRLSLAVGESSAAVAAWVRFPDLTVERLSQRYTRSDARQYRYESRDGAFTAGIEVDDHGLVIRYGDIWERVLPDS